VAEATLQSRVRNGLVVVFSTHTTAAIKINESEPELLKDMARFLGELAPIDRDYCHNNFDVRTVNMDGRLQLGRWQRIFLVELDRPKLRRVALQILGF
jgi:thiamine phosphate synthase YjbQ (UPF0047 family)